MLFWKMLIINESENEILVHLFKMQYLMEFVRLLSSITCKELDT